MGTKEIKMFMLTYVITLVIGTSEKKFEVVGVFGLFNKLCQLVSAIDADFTIDDLLENWEERENVLLHRSGKVEVTENIRIEVSGVSDFYMDVNIGVAINGQVFTGEPLGVYQMICDAGFPAFKVFSALNAYNQLREIREGDEFDIDDLTVVITELSC